MTLRDEFRFRQILFKLTAVSDVKVMAAAAAAAACGSAPPFCGGGIQDGHTSVEQKLGLSSEDFLLGLVWQPV